MAISQADLETIVARLRAVGGDNAAVEVKAAATALPSSISNSLSALANLPGGGVLILGLDESNGFRPVGLTDPQARMQALGTKARRLVPPVVLHLGEGTVDGATVVVAEIQECPPTMKPCRLGPGGKAYLRSHDGDFEMSQLEVQGFLRSSGSTQADGLAVPGTTTSDLDRDLVQAWEERLPDLMPRLSRFRGDELLTRAGIVTPEGLLTRAGLLVFGTYPQQHFPQLVIRAARIPGDGEQGLRAEGLHTIDGPIPVMLSTAMNWLRQNLRTSVVAGREGIVSDAREYPLDALRELVANALVHRDLDDWSHATPIELRIREDRLTLTNPGGLYGITTDRLGVEHTSSARNSHVVQLCQVASNPADGARVIEAIASGLTRVARSLDDAGLPAARFSDQAIRFTVVLGRPVQESRAAAVTASGSTRTDGLRHGTQLAAVHDAVVAGPGRTVAELAESIGVEATSVRRALTRLRELQLVELDGGRGRTSRYVPASGANADRPGDRE